MSDTQFDKIAQEYAAVINSLPTYQFLMANHRMQEGDVSGRRVLDLACGPGNSSRKLKEAGAEVVGLDISAGQIEVAQGVEANNPQGITYIVGDVGDANLGLIDGGNFDLATAFGLLHYATTETRLQTMLNNIYANLAPGGRMVISNLNAPLPAQDWVQYSPNWAKYDCRIDGSFTTPPAAGQIVHFMLQATPDADPVRFDLYYWPNEVFNRCFNKAGFVDVIWHPLELPEQFQDQAAFWQAQLEHPYVLPVSATRPQS